MIGTQRRARPLLGTLVEVGVACSCADGTAVFDAAFSAIETVQACMSRFEPDSDVSRFHAMAVGQSLLVDSLTAQVLHTAAWLQAESAGLFDIALGSARDGWQCEGLRLTKLRANVQLDLGGIAKGHAVDCAVAALRAAGCTAGWVNAGGDLRAFGDLELPISLRDEQQGGVRAFGALSDGAFATSHFGRGARSRIWPANAAQESHVSVMAPRCLWADALTKVVALSHEAQHPLLAALGAQAWLH
ncbi:MAG: FAD:protein FMN transferase [Rhizobacter sp.]